MYIQVFYTHTLIIFKRFLISGLCQWNWMGLYCHSGTITKYLSGFLADGVGTGDCNYSNGDSRRGQYSFLFIDFSQPQKNNKCWWRGILTCREKGRVGVRFWGSDVFPGKGHPLAGSWAVFWPRLSLLPQEGGREKSFRYWPRLGSRHNTVTYGRFKITTRFRTDSGCYATTGLKMKHLLTGQERTVWHLQYTDWPEHGCPEDLKGFLCEYFRSQLSLCQSC